MRARKEAEFAKTEAETAKDKVEEEGYEAGWLKPRPPLKLKSLEYASYTAPKFGTRPLNELGWRLHPTCGSQRAYFILQLSVRPPLPAPRL